MRKAFDWKRSRKCESEDVMMVPIESIAWTGIEEFPVFKIIVEMYSLEDCLCGLAVRVRGYRSRGPCSIPGATFSEK
jgi:hypothetical protein